MYDLSRFVVLKCMSKATRLHGITDESRKGGPFPSFLYSFFIPSFLPFVSSFHFFTLMYHFLLLPSHEGGASILASGLKGEFDVDGETVVVDALIDLDFICNQETATEADSFENALHMQLDADDPELHAEVDILDIRSMASDHAKGAQATSKAVGEKKDIKFASLTIEEVHAMTPAKLNLAKSFDATTCQNHLLNLLTTAWVGKTVPRPGDPDKAMAAHGENESTVQFHMIGSTIIAWHDHITTGRRLAAAIPEDAIPTALLLSVKLEDLTDADACVIPSSADAALQLDTGHTTIRGLHGTPVKDARLGLLRWGWQRMQWRWHKCSKNKNPAPFDSESTIAISEVLYAAAKLFGGTGDFTSYYLNEGRILKAWARLNQCAQKALWKAFKSSRMNWHVECAAVLLQNSSTCLPFLHQLRVCTNKPNKLVLKVWGGLSCKYTMAAFAARTHFFLGIINPVRFAINCLCKLADIHAMFDIVLECLNQLMPKRQFLDKLLILRPAWAPRITMWRESMEKMVTSAWASTAGYENLMKPYVKALCPKVK